MKVHFIAILKQKSGIAIMSVMLFFMVMTIFLGALSFSSLGNARVSGSNSQSMAAFYAAEAGTNVVIDEIRTLRANTSLSLADFVTAMNHILTRNNGLSFNLASNGGSDVIVRLAIENDHHDSINRRYVFDIVSTGEFQGQTRTLSTFVEVDYGRLGDDNNNFRLRHAVLVRNTLTTGNGSIEPSPNSPTLITRIATLASATNSLNLNSGLTFTGEIELTAAGKATTNLVTSTFQNRINSTILITENRDAVSPEIRVNFPEINFGPIRTTRDSVISSGNFTQANTLSDIVQVINGVRTIPGGNYRVDLLDFTTLPGEIRINTDVFIITNQLTLGRVTFSGNGMLTIYANPSIVGRSNFIQPADNNRVFGRVTNPEKLAIYVDTVINQPQAYDVVFPNGSKTTGYFMFNNANISFSSGATLFGSIFTGAINRPGPSNNPIIFPVRLWNNSSLTEPTQRSLIVAPNGTVNFENGSQLIGAVIANNVSMSNQARIFFDPDFPQRIPFDVTSPIMLAPSDNFGINRLVIHRTTER